jgi:hypothetical protein
MMQKRSGPAATTRAGDDFEWVNSWAEASGLKAAREFAAQPVRPIPPPAAVPNAVPAAAAPVRRVIAATSDQLARDIAEIERARDAIIAAEGRGVFALPRSRPAAPRERLLGRRDAMPVMIGAALAMFMLIAYGVVATFMALGH